MSSVTKRISEIKQPRGGYVSPSLFSVTNIEDEAILSPVENIHPTVVGMVVDYLTRTRTGANKAEVFFTSLSGARMAERMYHVEHAMTNAMQLMNNIKGLDDKSIICACKLVTYDVWTRNQKGTMTAKGYEETNPDQNTIQNIRTMVNRSLAFFDCIGKPIEERFTFEPEKESEAQWNKMIENVEGNYGGYTATVDSGEGDFLTEDTLWDFKVSKEDPKPAHTLQLLMYWIMGQHSGQKIYEGITNLGIFNPRLNKIYLLDINNVSIDTIRAVERNVICYE